MIPVLALCRRIRDHRESTRHNFSICGPERVKERSREIGGVVIGREWFSRNDNINAAVTFVKHHSIRSRPQAKAEKRNTDRSGQQSCRLHKILLTRR